MHNRIYFFDNIKFVLIVLVVMGHFCESYALHASMLGLQAAIYSFHMPLFVFVSGYFSKNIIAPRRAEVVILFTYILFQFYLYGFKRITGLGHGDFLFLYPTFANWYLLGLFLWRVTVPYLNFFSSRQVLVFTYLLAFVIGFDNEIVGSALYRIIYFMPCFLIGYYCDDLTAIVNKYSKYWALFIILFFVFMAGIFMVAYHPKFGTVLMRAYLPLSPYISFGNYKYGIVARLLGTCSSLIISWCCLFVIPQRKTWFSKYGQNTFFVYLFHIFFVWSLAEMAYRAGITELYVTVCSFAIVFVLSNATAMAVLDEVVNFKLLRGLFKSKKDRNQPSQ